MARAGRYEPAEVIAQSVSDPSRRAYAVMWVAEAAAEAGKHETAKPCGPVHRRPGYAGQRPSAGGGRAREAREPRGGRAHRPVDHRPRRRGTIRPDPGSHGAGDGRPTARAADAASEAEAAAGLIDGLSQRAAALVRVAEAFERAGLHAQADAAVNRAEAVARSITEPDEQDDALASATTELVRVGQYERAEAMARSIASPVRQKWAIGEVAVALVEPATTSRQRLPPGLSLMYLIRTPPCGVWRRSRASRLQRAGHDGGAVHHRPSPAVAGTGMGRGDSP